MELSDQAPPPRGDVTLAWAKEALGGRVAVLAGRGAGGVGYGKESRYGSPAQVTEIRVDYPEVAVVTVRYPSQARPGAGVADLVREAIGYADIPDDLSGDEVEAWMTSPERDEAPVLEPSPETLVIGGTAYEGERWSARSGMYARVARLDGLVVVVTGKDIDRFDLAWA